MGIHHRYQLVVRWHIKILPTALQQRPLQISADHSETIRMRDKQRTFSLHMGTIYTVHTGLFGPVLQLERFTAK